MKEHTPYHDLLHQKKDRYKTIGGLTALALTLTPLSACAGNETAGHEKSCIPFTAYAQNNYPPAGAVLLDAPSQSTGKVIASKSPNQVIETGKWVRAESEVYPDNPEVYTGTAWLQVTLENPNTPKEQVAWVSTSAVRPGKSEQSPDQETPSGGAFVTPEYSGADYGFEHTSSNQGMLKDHLVKLQPECEIRTDNQ